MKQQITKTEAQAFKARWEVVNAAERLELCNTSPANKLRQLAALMASVKAFGWTKALSEEEEMVRERWNTLRRKYHV